MRLNCLNTNLQISRSTGLVTILFAESAAAQSACSEENYGILYLLYPNAFAVVAG